MKHQILMKVQNSKHQQYIKSLPVVLKSKSWKILRSKIKFPGISPKSPLEEAFRWIWFYYTSSILIHLRPRQGLFIYLRKKLLICFLIKALRPRNFPYIRCRTVLRKSLSLGSSESKSSKSWRTNFWSMTFFPMLGWKSGDSRNRKKNS